MMQLQPTVRLVLILFAAAIAGLGAVSDELPIAVQAIVASLAAALAGLGIIPPHVPTRTSVNTDVEPVSVVKEQ